MRVKATAAALGATLLACVFATTASAKIEPQVGIAGIELGMTPAEVIAKKGQPDSDKVVPVEILGTMRRMRYGKTEVRFFPAPGSTVFSIRTRSKGQRTDDGAGVGSREKRVRESLPKAKCRTEGGRRFCFVGKFRPGKVVTVFFFQKKTKRVSRVDVGIVID